MRREEMDMEKGGCRKSVSKASIKDKQEIWL